MDDLRKNYRSFSVERETRWLGVPGGVGSISHGAHGDLHDGVTLSRRRRSLLICSQDGAIWRIPAEVLVPRPGRRAPAQEGGGGPDAGGAAVGGA